MYLKRLKLFNFRNIAGADIGVSPGFNIFLGDNAQGKTNTLEAIYLLGHLKSFRRVGNMEMIGPCELRSRIHGEFFYQDMLSRLELTLGRETKTILLDGKIPEHAGAIFSRYSSVLFSPEEVGIVKGSPAGRRAMLDRAICQTDPLFLDRARAFQRCLKQRNALLKNIAQVSTTVLESWNEEFIKTGARIRFDRHRYLQRLMPRLKDAYRHIANGLETADLIYPIEGHSQESYEDGLRRDMQQLRTRETQYGVSLAGPHRDDPIFLVNERPLAQYGSQGQQRSFMLAFKTAQVLDLEAACGRSPLLLLDDMTSELDQHRQAFFFQFLQDRTSQVFVTATEIGLLRLEGLKELRIFHVENGVLRDN